MGDMDDFYNSQGWLRSWTDSTGHFSDLGTISDALVDPKSFREFDTPWSCVPDLGGIGSRGSGSFGWGYFSSCLATANRDHP